jgi:hypothetical protein
LNSEASTAKGVSLPVDCRQVSASDDYV